MNKRLLSVTASSLLALTACGGGSDSSVTINPVNPEDGEIVRSSVSFQPAAGTLSLPNDLLFAGTADGTLEVPDEVSGREAGSIDFSNPAAALGGIAGWSRQVPFKLALEMAEGATLNAASITGKVVIIEASASTGDTSDPLCPQTPAGLPCAPVAPLQEGVDFAVVPGTDSLTIVPLKLLKPATIYTVALLSGIEDSRGELIAPSPTYEILTDASIDVSGNDSLASLRGAVSVYQGVIQAGSGGAITADDFIYSMAMTTQGVITEFDGIAGSLLSAPPTIAITDSGNTVRTFMTSHFGADPGPVFDIANYYTGSITLPYYLGIPTVDNPTAPLTDPWTAACDSGVTLQAATPEEIAAATPDAFDAICSSIGLRSLGLDTERHVTRYNPLPKARADVNLDIQMTVPAAGCGTPCPVVILQHGITSKKEDMLSMTAGLAAEGFVTIAIDHPLHGSRGFDIDGDNTDEFNASTVSATHYMNLAYLMVARDNLRQSISDLLGLRMGLNNLTGASVSIDTNNISIAGLSLGAMSATGFAAVAANLGGPFDIQHVSLNSPGGGTAAFLSESANFGPLVRATVISAAGLEVSAALQTFMATPADVCAGTTPGTEPYTTCQYGAFVAQLTAENDTASLAAIDETIAAFIFAAQTILDAGDPSSFATALVASGVPIHMTEIVGDGGSHLPDQVIPNQTFETPFGGTEPLAKWLALDSVGSGNSPTGLVRFTEGAHSSIIDTTSSSAVTMEIQAQVVEFVKGNGVTVTDTSVVAPATTP